jgi:hypothetical protein
MLEKEHINLNDSNYYTNENNTTVNDTTELKVSLIRIYLIVYIKLSKYLFWI